MNSKKCPECGYIMQNMYIQTQNRDGKRTWKTTGSICCFKCKIEKSQMKITV